MAYTSDFPQVYKAEDDALIEIEDKRGFGRSIKKKHFLREVTYEINKLKAEIKTLKKGDK